MWNDKREQFCLNSLETDLINRSISIKFASITGVIHFFEKKNKILKEDNALI